MKDESWKMKDEGWRLKDEGQRLKYEGWKMKNKGWRRFCRQTNKWTDRQTFVTAESLSLLKNEQLISEGS